MKLNSPLWPLLFTLEPLIAASLAAPWDCKVTVQSASWDLTSLGIERIVTRSRSSPPSEFVEEVRWNTCNELKEREGYDNADQVCRSFIEPATNADGGFSSVLLELWPA